MSAHVNMSARLVVATAALSQQRAAIAQPPPAAGRGLALTRKGESMLVAHLGVHLGD